ncbi:MAG: hypothetical protein PXY39_08945 [archaeon]|nr:hypothetical protein [archaeon]
MTDAMERWTKEKEETDTVAAALSILDEGLPLGGVRYKHRDELHER